MCKARRPLAKAVGLKITGSIKTAPALTTIVCLRISVDEAAGRGYGSERYAQGGVEVMPLFVPRRVPCVCQHRTMAWRWFAARHFFNDVRVSFERLF